MSDIAANLRRTRADMLGTDDEEHYWHCHEAADEIERLTACVEHHQAVEADQERAIERLQSELGVWKANAETNLGEVERLQALLNAEMDSNHRLSAIELRLRSALERISKRARQKWSEGKEDGWLWVYKTADEALRDE